MPTISSVLRQCCSPSHVLQTAVIIIVMIFILIGAVIFQALENENAGAIIEHDNQNFLNCVEKQLSFSKNYYNKDAVMASIIAKNCFRSRHGQWNFADSVLFAFGIVTTIGYGNVFPHTSFGKIFCCFYALVGIPLTMIAIANIGKYLAILLQRIEFLVETMFKTSYFAPFRTIYRKIYCFGRKNRQEDALNDKISGKTFIIIFMAYIAFGSYAISWWEPELKAYSTAFYFNLLSLTSAGLGDYSPKSGSFLLLTMLYLTVGLAITSISLDLGSDYLRKLHYYREKISNVRNVIIRLGSKKVTVGRFLTVICVHLGVSKDLIDNLDLDNIMQNEMDRRDENNNKDDSVHSLPDIVTFNPEISGCIDEEVMSLLSVKSVAPKTERHELLWPTVPEIAKITVFSYQKNIPEEIPEEYTVHIGVNNETIDNLDLDNIMQSEFDRADEKEDSASAHPDENIATLSPEIFDCIDVEMQNLLQKVPEPKPSEAILERYELLLPTIAKTATVHTVSFQKDRQKCEIRMKQLQEKYESLNNCEYQWAKSETIEILNLASTLEIRYKILLEDFDTFSFPQTEIALTEFVEFHDRSSELAMIPFKEEEYKEFHDKHRNAIRRNSKPTPGRPDYKFDPKKAHEIYRKEWERMDEVIKKQANELAKKRRQRIVEAWKKATLKK